MTQSINNHKTYILHFSYDDEDASALTVLINHVRFHITVDPKNLQKSREKLLYYEYLDKISTLREVEEREEDRAEERQAKVHNGKKSQRQSSESKDSGIDVTSSLCSDYGEEEEEEE
jgi:hypothetical protein